LDKPIGFCRMNTMRLNLLIRAVGLAGGITIASIAARADDCATVMSANFAQAKVPYASTTTSSQPNQPLVRSELVVIDTKMYFQVNGAWQSMPYSAQELIDRETEKAKKSKLKPTCQKVGAEIVNGEATTVYSADEDNGGQIIDSRVWISDSRSLPLKLEVHIGSMTMTVTTRYDNIQPPAGAK